VKRAADEKNRGKPGKEGMRLHSEKSTFPRREPSHHSGTRLKLGWKSEEGGEGCRHPEQRDHAPISRRGTGIAHEMRNEVIADSGRV